MKKKAAAKLAAKLQSKKTIDSPEPVHAACGHPERTCEDSPKDSPKVTDFPKQIDGIPVLAPDHLRRLRFIKALLSVQSAERYLREVIMLESVPGQAEVTTNAQIMAWACITDADRYLKKENDEILEALAKTQREKELELEILKLGPKAEYAVAK